MGKELTEAELDSIKEAVARDVALQRQRLLMKHQFIGNIIMQLNMVPVRDCRCRTACTDGTSVYVDVAFWSDLNDDERQFILAHEVWHCVYMHFLRKQSRDQSIFNIATDMEVNRMLQSDGFIPPAEVLFPKPEWGTKSAEEMYELILKELKKRKQKQSGAGSQGAPASGSGGSQQDGDGGSEDSVPDFTAKKNGKSSQPQSKAKGQFDKHIYNGQDKDDMESGDGVSDKYGKVGFDRDFCPEVSKNIAEKIREMVIDSAERTQRMAGQLPAGLKEYLDTLIKPELDWKAILAQFVTSCYNGKRRWLPPARRHVYNGIYLQSRRDERIRVAVAVDTSGSCLGDLPKFFGELNGLLNSFGNYELLLIECDAEVDKVERYDQDKPFPEEASKIEWSGGGGTSFAPPFKWIQENGEQVDCFIYFTDGEEWADNGVSKMQAPPYPVLWILTKDGNEQCCPWGAKIKFENDSPSHGEW